MRLSKLITGLLMGFATAAMAVPPPNCLTDKYQSYTQAQRTWQYGVTRLIVKVAPKYEDVAQRYLEDQLRSIQRRELEVAFFAHAEPAKLRTHRSLNNWLSLSEADRQRVASNDESYAQLLKEARGARSRPAHPDGDTLREVMKNEIMTSPEYKTLLQALLESVKAAEAIECGNT